MKEITISGRKHSAVVLVDDADYDWLTERAWCLMKTKSGYYAVSGQGHDAVMMHREILGLGRGRYGTEVDHRNGITLDNRRGNLRAATHQQNMCNRKRHRDNSTGFTGVTWHAQKRLFTARLWVNGVTLNLGYFRDAESAARKRDEAAREHHGEFARLNFPEQIAA